MPPTPKTPKSVVNGSTFNDQYQWFYIQSSIQWSTFNDSMVQHQCFNTNKISNQWFEFGIQKKCTEKTQKMVCYLFVKHNEHK